MSSFSDGFITGFANTLAAGVEERHKIAQDYFQNQYELATTVGLQNHRKVEAQVQGNVKVAKQLQQMGVPKNIIMAVASQDPTSLSDFYGAVSDAQANGVVLDEGFFNDFVQISKDFKAPDESFESFFSKAFRPVAQAARENPEQFKSDRKGGIFATMMGADPYGRARQRLDETVVIDGMSATDLLAYGERYQPQGTGSDVTVTFDSSKTRRPKEDKEGGLSVSETRAIDSDIEELADLIKTQTNTNDREANRKAAAAQLLEKYAHLPEAVEYLRRIIGEETPIEEPTSPIPTEEPAPLPTGGTEEPVPEKVSAFDSFLAGEMSPGARDSWGVGDTLRSLTPMGQVANVVSPLIADSQKTLADPIDTKTESDLAVLIIDGVEFRWVGNDEEGNAIYQLPNGEQIPLDPVTVRDFVSLYGTNFQTK